MKIKSPCQRKSSLTLKVSLRGKAWINQTKLKIVFLSHCVMFSSGYPAHHCWFGLYLSAPLIAIKTLFLDVHRFPKLFNIIFILSDFHEDAKHPCSHYLIPLTITGIVTFLGHFWWIIIGILPLSINFFVQNKLKGALCNIFTGCKQTTKQSSWCKK